MRPAFACQGSTVSCVACRGMLLEARKSGIPMSANNRTEQPSSPCCVSWPDMDHWPVSSFLRVDVADTFTCPPHSASVPVVKLIACRASRCQIETKAVLLSVWHNALHLKGMLLILCQGTCELRTVLNSLLSGRKCSVSSSTHTLPSCGTDNAALCDANTALMVASITGTH